MKDADYANEVATLILNELEETMNLAPDADKTRSREIIVHVILAHYGDHEKREAELRDRGGN
jgi:hypothetical protein